MSPSLAKALAHMPLVRRLPRRVRAALLTVHVAASAGWLGLDGALVVLEVIGLNSADQALQTGISIAMAAIACWILIPLVFASLCTGLVLAVGTSWGLARHWWLIAKAGIAAVLTVTGVVLILPRLSNLVVGDGEPLQLRTVAMRSVALVLLLVATGLSVVKPWGKTGFTSARKTPTTATVPAPVKVRTTDPLLAVRPTAPEPRMHQARPAQLHALRALHGQRDFRPVSDEPGSRGCRVLVIGSRTWIDPTNVAATAESSRPQGRAVPKSHWPRSPLRRSVDRMRA
jgi:hypothetical protein